MTDAIKPTAEQDDAQLLESLKEKFGIDANDSARVAGALYSYASLPAHRVARIMSNTLKLSPDEIAQIFYDRDGLGIRAEEVAWALHKGLGLSAEKTASVMCELLKDDDEMYKNLARALFRGLELDTREVARVLTSRDGPAWSPSEVFRTLHTFDRRDEYVADALHHGAGLSIHQTARLLYYGTGDIEGDEYGVARALRDGLGLMAVKVAHVFHRPEGLYLGAEAVARVLYDPKGFDLDEFAVARVLRSEAGLGLPVEDVARVLSHGLNIEKPAIAKALKSVVGLGLSDREVVRVLHSREGLGLSAKDIVDVLSSEKGLGLPATEIVELLGENGIEPDAALFDPVMPCEEDAQGEGNPAQKEDPIRGPCV